MINDIEMMVMRMGYILRRGEEQGEERTRKGGKNVRKQNIDEMENMRMSPIICKKSRCSRAFTEHLEHSIRKFTSI